MYCHITDKQVQLVNTNSSSAGSQHSGKMSHMKSRIYKLLPFLTVLILALQGCVATQSFPTIARSGDTISLAVGSPTGMTKANTTAQFVSDTDASVTDLTVRAVIRLRPDQTSSLALYDQVLDYQTIYTAHSQWITILVLDLPTGITVGTGQININSTASYGELSTGINNLPIALEIIDGIGQQNDFSYTNVFGSTSPGDLSAAEPSPQIVFQPPIIFGATTNFAAAEIKVNIPMQNVTQPWRDVRVVADDFYKKNPLDQVQMMWARNGNDLTITFISHKGTMEPVQLRFSIVKPTNVFSSVPGPTITSLKFYDINGALLTTSDGIPNTADFSIAIQ